MSGFQGANKLHVVVVNSNSCQKQLITTVLKRSNHIISFVDHVNEIPALQDTIFAVVVCHQVCVNEPKPVFPALYDHIRIIVMSDCSTEQHIVDALEQGAHHFINTRDSYKVLKARLYAALRQHDLQVAEYLPYKFRMVERQVELSGRKIKLNPREFDCAHYFFRHNNRIIKTEELMVSVWALPPHLDSRRIDTATCRLRKKLALHNREYGWFLERLRGVGFRLTNDTGSLP